VALSALGWLWWRTWFPFDEMVAAAVAVAGVALGDIDFHFTWPAWRFRRWAGSGGALDSRLTPWSLRLLATATSTLRGRYGAHIQLAHAVLDTLCTQCVYIHSYPISLFHARLFPTHNFYTPRLFTHFFHQQHFYSELFHAPPFDIFFLRTPILHFFSFSCLSHAIFTFL
jgi:hypothetical protein